MTNVIEMRPRRQADENAQDTLQRLHAAMPRMVEVDWRPSPQRIALLDYIDSLPPEQREQACESTGDRILYDMWLLERGGQV